MNRGHTVWLTVNARRCGNGATCVGVREGTFARHEFGRREFERTRRSNSAVDDRPSRLALKFYNFCQLLPALVKLD